MLPSVNRKIHFVVIQMQRWHIKAYSTVSSSMNYKVVRYFSVKTLVYCKDNLICIFFKEFFAGCFQITKLTKSIKTRSISTNNQIDHASSADTRIRSLTTCTRTLFSFCIVLSGAELYSESLNDGIALSKDFQ